jgi:hypothetical protein
MKKILKYISFALAIPLLATSCLKDDTLIGPDAPNAITNVIEFKNPGAIISGTSSKLPLYSLAYDIVPAAEVVLELNYAGSGVAPEDIQIKVKLDNSLIDQYASDFNKLNPDDKMDPYTYLDPSWYSIPTYDVTIKKGERVGKLIINLKPDQITFDDSYALAFSIESSTVGNISKSFGKIVTLISAKNFFDGTYKYTTSATTSLVPNASKTVTLTTIGSSKCSLSPGLLGTYSNEVNYTIDPSTNKITVECPSLGVQTPQDTRSVYDPATKTLKVYWKQGNGGRTFEETFVYTGPRD